MTLLTKEERVEPCEVAAKHCADHIGMIPPSGYCAFCTTFEKAFRIGQREAFEKAASLAQDSWNHESETCNMKWHAGAIARVIREKAKS